MSVSGRKVRKSNCRRRHLISKFPHFEESLVFTFALRKQKKKKLDFNRSTESILCKAVGD